MVTGSRVSLNKPLKMMTSVDRVWTAKIGSKEASFDDTGDGHQPRIGLFMISNFFKAISLKIWIKFFFFN